MKLCCPECFPICDFCVHYRFNPGFKGRYEDNGCCMLHYLPEDPDGECEYFECGMDKDN